MLIIEKNNTQISVIAEQKTQNDRKEKRNINMNSNIIQY